MRNKRYIYSSFVAGFFFLLCYLILDINFIISFIITIISYIAGIFMFKEKDIRKYDPKIIMNYYFVTSKLVSMGHRIKDNSSKANIDSIGKSVENILKQLEQRPKKVGQVYDFFDYYLQLAVKLTSYYVGLLGNGKLSDDDKLFMEKFPEYIGRIKTEFDKVSDNMKLSKSIDIKKEIKLFESISGISDTQKLEVEKSGSK